MAEHGSDPGERTGLEVAVVGMAGRFPGADDVDAFWRNLRKGVESIRRYSREELIAAGVDPRTADRPDYVPVRGELRGADEFDATLFGLTPRDAEVLNPQHRVLLECAWAALEHGGYDPARVERPIGVFAGSGTNHYALNLASSPELVRTVGMLRITMANEKDHLAAGISYRLNLRGPSMAVQTACSTSLVSVHVACQSLINGECDLALAGGVSIGTSLRGGYVYSPDGILSPDGHCRAFDADARGAVAGFGAGMVLLKRLEDAIEDGDTIHAVIRGSAINNDGAQKVGYTAPSVMGQARVLSEALSVAGVDPGSLQYLETHGTGTPLGDAIELKAMGQALARSGGDSSCAIGSVKTNVGHLDAAAGVAGLIKTVLSLSHAELPPSLNFSTPHPEIAASGGRVFVNTELRPWPRNGTPRRAGVSSFGMGGTNAHAVLEEAPPREPSGPSRDLQLLVLSARTATALAAAAENLADALDRETTPLADAAYTLQTGRREMEHRLAIVCGDAAEGAARLRQASGRASTAIPRTDRPLAFLLPGLGMHHVDMGRGLYDAEPAYRAAVDECCELLRPVLGSDLREVMFSAGAAKAEAKGGGWDLRGMLGRGAAAPAPESTPLDDTRFAQPAVFVTEYALAKLWMSWGVAPRALLGHSLGEYVAACVAGVLRLEDALRLVALRARLIDGLPAGAMLAVPLGEDALRGLLPAGLDLAAVNTPESCVVAGPVEEIEAFEAVLAGRELVSRRLPTRHAFHSRMMAPVAGELERLVRGFTLRAPEIPFVSNVTGTWISDDDACSPEYWARHLCQPVRFADGIATLRAEPGWVFLEVGPGQTLGAWAMQHPAGGSPEARVVLSSLRHQHNRVPDPQFLLETLGGLWAAGVPVDWTAYSRDERRHRVPLPVYPFERKRYWVDRPLEAQPPSPEQARAAAAGEAEQARAAAASEVERARAEAAAEQARASAGTWEAGNAVNGAHQKGPDVMENRFAAQEIATAPSPRYEAILDRLKALASELTGIEAQFVSTDVHFFQAGIDSLLLLQAIQMVEKQIGVRLSLIDLLEEITTLDALAEHIDSLLPADVVLNGTQSAPETAVALAEPEPEPASVAIAEPAPAPAAAPIPAAAPEAPRAAAAPSVHAAPAAPAGAEGVLERVIAQQLQLMQQQIAAIRGEPAPFVAAAPAAAAPSIAAAAAPIVAAAAPIVAAPAVPAAPAADAAPAAPAPAVPPAAVPQSPRASIQPETFVAHQPLSADAPGGMTPEQKAYVDGFIARYTERTKASKAHQVKYHLPLADGRVTARFRRALKEIAYPIVGDRARGAYVWDADGNEYVDIGMAYGCNLFGHGPDFVSRAIQEQVERGYGVGPQSPLAGRAAELICELGGVERAIFCNSGTEAVMGAIRAARTYTGRTRVAYFAGSYHGWSDIVQGRPVGSGEQRQVRPTAPGISQLPLDDVLLLDWDQPSSLETLARHLDELAVVVVEPVQSRRLDIQPHAFLRELRRMTRDAGVMLHFDELITGFRIGAGGAQSFFGVDADLVTYGKIVAGGLPMGVVAGKREVMSVFDGGLWSYGDDSYPTGQRTLFAGAFFKHPLSMGAVCAIMEEIRRRGPEMYDALNARTARLVERCNAFFEAEGYPVTTVSFGSVFRFFLGAEVKFPDLFYNHLVMEGIYVQLETGTGFLSVVHTDEDLDRVFRAVQRSVEAMRRGGLIPPPPGGGPAPRGEDAPAGAGPSQGDGPASVQGPADAPAVPVSADSAGARPAAELDVDDGAVSTFPLTEGQRQLWIESQLGDEAGLAYIEASSTRLHGAFDVDALGRAVQALVDRHETLRATFGVDGDVQHVHPRLRMEVPFQDFRPLAPEARGARLEEWIRGTVRRSFDLVNGPLVRFGVAALEDDLHVLVVAAHHAILDGWSFDVVMQELGELYVAARDGRAAQLPPRPSLATLVRAQVDAVRLDEAAEAFWTAQFAGGVPVLDLPTDRPRPALRSYAGERQVHVMRGGLMAGVARMARQHGFTMFNTIFSAYFAWLSRVTGQDDLVIGTPSAGQAARTGSADLVGYNINILPIRARVDASASFMEHTRRVRRTMLQALEHQNFSFPRLVEKVLQTRDPSRAPVFSALMNLDRVPDEILFGDVRAEVAHQFGGGAKVDLVFALTERGDDLHLACDYSTALFDGETIGHWLASFERMLEQLVEDGDARLSTLTLVGPEERARVVEEWNRTEREYPHVCIHELFESQVRRTPDAVAVVFGEARLTYAELDARANQVAHFLRARGAGPEDRVALCMDRGLELMAAFFGILKSGAAYVPLDPTHPAERLGYMLQDSGARLLLSQSWLEERLPAARPEALFVDALGEAIDAMPADRPESGVTPENLAYVYYTSGSTGRPKGVAMHHYGPANYFAWGKDAYRAAEGHGAPVFSSMAVDLTLANFIPLFAGERVELLPEGPGVEALADAIRREPGFAMIKITPTHLSLLNQALSPEDAAASTGTLVIGADNLMAEPTLFWQEHAPGVRLLNEYGPTETVVGCSLFELEQGTHAEGRIPIGRPIDNLTMYVLDAHLQPLPPGVPGELYIGGVGVARGYLGRPALTAEKFVPDPFAAAPGARFYRTGDRARFLSDGNIEFLGRVDFQVKIRGYRIETGEIESVLTAHAAVRDAMVVVREDVPGDRRLVAYVVPAEGAEPTADVLRAALRERVPEYMVPTAFVLLPNGFPVGSTGKVDRKTLPAPEYASDAERYVAPATPAEEAMAGIWAEVLGVERVGTADNFFELGGHSILATRVVSRARELLSVELPLRAVFEGPTVAQLARRVEALRAEVLRGEGEAAEPRPIMPAPRDRPLPVSFGQERMWFVHEMEAENTAYNVPLFLRLPGELDADVLERALAELVSRHEVLRTTFQAGDDGEPVQVVEPAGAFDLARVTLESLEPAEREARLRAMAREEAARPFDLARGPLVRATLVRLDEEDHVLLFTLHHVATDGWSMDILAAEAFALYGAFAAGQPSPLAPLPLQYADYAAWERGWLQGAVLERELDYWKTQLGGSPELLELPTDRPRPAVPSHRGGALALALPPELTGALQALAQREGATLFMVMLAAWQALLGRYSGQQDVVVGTTVANRTRREVEGLVGLFMNVLALRGDLSGDPAFRELLGRVRNTTLGAYEHQAVPFGKVVEVARPERSRSHEPLFQVLFELEHGAPALPPTGQDGPPAGAEGIMVKYDLTLTLRGDQAGLGGVLLYAADLFDRETAARMLDHYRMLLEQVARDGDVRLSALSLVGPEERARVVEEWNRTEREYPHVCIHELFESQVRATPDAVAVVFGEERLTYAELDARANQVAHFLRARGAGPEDRVALCMDRGLELMAAFFGILKSGAAYVPLDPTHPAERLGYMLQDSGARLLLTQSWLQERLPENVRGSRKKSRKAAARPELLFVDSLAAEIAAQPADRPESGVTPENLAYVYYTSGSTGRPKGVAMHHYGPANYFAWGKDAYRAAEGHGAPVFSSMAVDLTLANFIPLFAGERVELLPEGPGVESLADAIRRTPGFAMIKITPTHLSLLNQALSPEDAAASTGTLVIGADNLMAEPTLFWQEHAPGVRLLNEYGPTETVVGCSLFELEQGTHAEGRIPIGRPIDNLTMYVLDAHLQPLPPGVPGELYIGGVGVARGYLGRPALTAEKFVPDPFAPAPGARFYRTGDRARFLSDGNIEFLGRVDFQVKIRGYRIETGEIESVLTAHAAVRDAMVLVREDVPGDRRLVAYVVPAEGEEPTADVLRAALRERVPEYMVPTAFVLLPDGFPVGSTGKVDRKTLPAPEAQARAGEGYAAPSTPAERALVEIWEEVLNVSPVGVDDDFFALGGHSMMAVRLMSQIRRRLDAELPLSSLFEQPTVRRLALLLDGGEGAPDWSPLVAIQPEGGRVPMFFVHPIGGQVLCYVDLARALGQDQPFYGLQARDLTHVGDDEVTLEQMAAQYVQAIRTVRPHGPYLLGGWSFGGMVAFEMAQQLAAAGEQVPLLAILDTASPEGARRMAAMEESVVLASLACEEALKAGKELALTADDLRPLEPRERVERALDLLREAGVVTADVEPEWVQRLLHGHRARNEAMARYTPAVYPGALTLFRPVEALEDSDAPSGFSDPSEWRPYTAQPLRVETLPGHHATMGTGPQARTLAERLRAVVDDALGA